MDKEEEEKKEREKFEYHIRAIQLYRGWSLEALFCLSLLFLFIANFYSWLMTAYGLLLSGFLPPDTLGGLLRGETMVYIITMVLQMVIFLLYLLLPRVLNASFDRPKLVKYISLIVIPLLLFIVASAFFSFVSITYRAKANDYQQHIKEHISSIDKGINKLDTGITNQFNDYVAELEEQVIKSVTGKDESGFEGRGPIYKKRVLKLKYVRENFGGLKKINISSLTDTNSNLDILWHDTTDRLRELQQKQRIYEFFTADQEISHYAKSTSVTLSEIEENHLQLHNDSFNGETPVDDISVVFKKTFENINLLLKLSPNVDKTLYIAIFIALWPDLLSVTLVIILTITYRVNRMREACGPSENREKELLNEKKRLEQVIGLEEKVGSMRVEWQFLKKLFSGRL